jgi:RNA polymerase sigma-70 factor (ECF subfamily)
MTSPTPSPDIAAVLVDNHRRFLAFLARRVPTREIAEDILQDAFVRGLTKAPALASSVSVVAWFYRVLRNAIVDHYRRAGVEARAIERYAAETDDIVAPADAELYEVLCGCVRSLVTTLKPEYATAITRVDLEGAPLTAYANEARISPNNAGVRLHRARRALESRVRDVCMTCADHGCNSCTCRANEADMPPVHVSAGFDDAGCKKPRASTS